MKTNFLLPTLLRVLRDSDFSRGAHRVDAGVGVTGVGSLVRRLHVVQDQAAVGRHLDVTTVRTHWDAVPAAKREIVTKNIKIQGLNCVFNHTC